MQRTALRAAADAERLSKSDKDSGDKMKFMRVNPFDAVLFSVDFAIYRCGRAEYSIRNPGKKE